MSYILPMNRGKRSTPALSTELRRILSNVGQHIKIARKRRRISEQQLADLAYTSRRTVQRLEAGEPGVGIGILISVLMILNLEKDMLNIAHPDKDQHGLFLEQGRLPQRIREKYDPKYDF